jgi:hypothetical protein
VPSYEAATACDKVTGHFLACSLVRFPRRVLQEVYPTVNVSGPWMGVNFGFGPVIVSIPGMGSRGPEARGPDMVSSFMCGWDGL